MRTVRHLFPRLCDPDYLERAAAATVRGKRRRADVAWFLFRREAELARLREELAAGRYRPQPFELVTIRDPKRRLIARVPIADRVVHTALVGLMEPVFLRRLRPESYACRPGYGAHRAVLRLLELMQRYGLALHLDVRSYFPSIHPKILRRLLAAAIRDGNFLAVVDRVLEMGSELYRQAGVRARAGLAADWPPAGRGLPIGTYTSQLFAAHVGMGGGVPPCHKGGSRGDQRYLYLADFDHFVKRELKVPGYARYLDDLFFFGHRRAELRRWRREVAGWLAAERALRLKHPEARIISCRGHLDALGYRITRRQIRALPRALRRFRRRVVSELAADPGSEFERSLAATAGVVLF